MRANNESPASGLQQVVRYEFRALTAQAFGEETGVALQRTSPTMAGVFVRGLTGNKVNVFVDGIRYSNSAQRGGVNTFLDLIDQSYLEGIEVLRGPNSAEYGSDALGGSVQFLSQVPALAVGRESWRCSARLARSRWATSGPATAWTRTPPSPDS